MPRLRSKTRRHGSGSQILSATALIAILLPLASWALLDKWWGGEEATKGPLTCTVRNTLFLYEVSQKGTIECASNVDVKNEADAIGFHTTTVLEMVPEGTYVEPGDFLAKLDSSPLEQLLVERRIQCNEREASLVKADTALATARIKLDEYLNGLFPQNEQILSNDLNRAQEEFRQAEQTLGYSESMYRQGFVTRLTVEADLFSTERAKMELKQAKTKLTVLQDFKRKKQLNSLEAELAVAEATARYRRHVHELATEELTHIAEQIDKCLITAPAAGSVVYASNSSRGQNNILELGSTVWEHQRLFRLPNSDQMQVKVQVPEDKIALVQAGQNARIFCEAFPNVELVGEVEHVNEYASPTNWWGPQTKVYDTLITIDTESTKAAGVDLRPGLSAEVFIQVDRREEQLILPFQAVLKQGRKRFCITHDRDGFHAREVQVGPSNGKFVVVTDGVAENEQVVLGAANYRKEVTLPE
jgi:HlyD family secretion protein